MKLFSRSIRRLFVVIIFLAILGFGWWFFKRVNTPISTCTDRIQNGQEEGIDCGIIACGIECQPELGSPQVISKKLISARLAEASGVARAGIQDYDFVAEIKNPHSDYGASEVTYELVLLNGNGQELVRKEGLFYILPEETKFLILPFLTTERNVSDIDFKIKSVIWQKVDLNSVNLTIVRQNYTALSGGKSSFLEAVILNDSDFDFETVEVDVVLRNSKGTVIAVNRSVTNTLLAHTERGFKVVWPFPIAEKVAKVEIYPSTNLFENSNFIKRYGSGIEQFQQY